MFFNFSNSEGNIVGLFQCQNGTVNPAKLLFYNDVEGHGTDWNSIYYDDSLSCEERTSKAQLIVPLEIGIMNANTQLGIKPSSVPHYWYVAISSCAYPSFAASAKIEFLNAGWDKNWITSQFSFDDQVKRDIYSSHTKASLTGAWDRGCLKCPSSSLLHTLFVA